MEPTRPARCRNRRDTNFGWPGGRRSWCSSRAHLEAVRRRQPLAVPVAEGRITFVEEPPASIRLDKSALSISHSFDDAEGLAFWHAQTPEIRLRQVEKLRRVNYGRRATSRLQRVLEISRR